MGNKSSKSQGLLGKKSTKKYGGDDGCIGNRKVRTLTMSLLLVVFFGMGLSYFFNQQDFWGGNNDSIVKCQFCEDLSNAYILIIIGSFAVIGSAIFAILLFFINCDDKLGRLAGVGLIVGGMLYLGGWLWIISKYNDSFKDNLFWDSVSDDTKERINAMC